MDYGSEQRRPAGWPANECEVVPASEEDAAKAIDLLDGVQFDIVGLVRALNDNPEEAESLLISGGESGRVFMTYELRAPNWSDFYSLVDPSRGDDAEEGIVGGQRCTHPARLWVPKDQAIRAATWFCRVGGRDPELTWQFDVRQ